ncbi:unnamed protein product [Acanthoscelides obtectus]|uniref:DDE Tnp4 domain-containing protein n=1 Tax=Acanthoscelides obtectus TaxID=200917 RepID=A0A9P0NUC4_ACAOB|nr:unnamed protein product [Acanthoscelides obtectus]CAK1663695.1 hypothetical protein AOBTE_LOCUS23804 [Acanthoscelides obtectus]
MKPFPGHHAVGTPKRLFNQKLSSSRVTIENTFGIISSVFRIFKRPIPLNIPKASLITMICVLLHNFLRKSKTSRHMYTPPNSVDKYVNEIESIYQYTFFQIFGGTPVEHPGAIVLHFSLLEIEILGLVIGKTNRGLKDILQKGETVQEAIDIVFGENDDLDYPVEAIYIAPPEPAVLTDKDSGDEDEGPFEQTSVTCRS